MERWYQAAEKRFSVRTYQNSLSKDEMDSLKEYADSIKSDTVRIVLARDKGVFAGKLTGIKVKGTDCYAAIISKNGRSVEAGYLGELFILECVARGFGTCWLGASFRMNSVKRAIEINQGEAVCAITPIGYFSEPYKQRQRRSISSLTGLAVQDFLQLPTWQQDAVKCARRAPSALNAQPWDFDILNKKSMAVVSISSNLGYGKLDCGIAMLHIELGAAHNLVYGEWEVMRDEMVFDALALSSNPEQNEMEQGKKEVEQEQIIDFFKE